MPGNSQLTTPFDLARDLFLTAKEAERCTARTVKTYRWTPDKFIAWLDTQGVHDAQGITAHHVRLFLAHLDKQGSLPLNRGGCGHWRPKDFSQRPLVVGQAFRHGRSPLAPLAAWLMGRHPQVGVVRAPGVVDHGQGDLCRQQHITAGKGIGAPRQYRHAIPYRAIEPLSM
jgi:hypothetical protein